jgi:transposase InsO family protein
VFYVLIVMEHASRRIIHFNVTDHPTANWTTQQFREALPSNHEYRFLIHDRDSIYAAEFDEQIRSMGLSVVKIPARAPKANALCERLIGTIRRECLDFLIPLVKSTFAAYYVTTFATTMKAAHIQASVLAYPMALRRFPSGAIIPSGPVLSFEAGKWAVFSMRLRRTEVDENGVSGTGGQDRCDTGTLIPGQCLI